MTKVSLVITVLNEEQTIRELLLSLLKQDKFLIEVIVVDAGSRDKTVQIIHNLQSRAPKLKLVISPLANRSKGRNIGIRKAKGEIIAVTDAGCLPDPNWLKEISKPFSDKDVEVVGGWYRPDAETVFQKALAVYTCVLPHQFNPKIYLPSSRSLAFKKSVWEKAGGYPEELDTCEDLVFIQRLKAAFVKLVIAKDALVFWHQQESFPKAFYQLFNYAKGDGQALYRPHLTRALTTWLRYLIGLSLFFTFPVLLLFLLPQYFAFVIGKGYPYLKSKHAFYLLPLMQLVADLAVMTGSLTGIINRLTGYRSLLK